MALKCNLEGCNIYKLVSYNEHLQLNVVFTVAACRMFGCMLLVKVKIRGKKTKAV